MDMRRFRSVINWFYMLVRRDFWRKLIALSFALLLYFYVNNEIRATQKIPNVPVEIVLPPELMDGEPKPHFVTLEIKCARNSEVSPSLLSGHAQVEYSQYLPGRPYTLTLKPEAFESPLGIRVIRVEPREITLNLQRRMTRDVPVKVKFSNVSNEYRTQASCIPSTVRVTGPEHRVRDLKSVSTQPVPLSDVPSGSFEYVATLDLPSETVIFPKEVTCQIEFSRKYEQRTFSSLPVALLTQPGGRPFRTEFTGPSRVDVTVRGLAGSVSALLPGEVRPYLDITHIDRPGIYEVSTACFLKGDGLDVKEIRPSQIKIKVTE